MARASHLSLSRTPTACLYWRNNRGSSNNNNSKHSRPTQVKHSFVCVCVKNGDILSIFLMKVLCVEAENMDNHKNLSEFD